MTAARPPELTMRHDGLIQVMCFSLKSPAKFFRTLSAGSMDNEFFPLRKGCAGSTNRFRRGYW